jgi:hypothetical protein
MAQTKTYRTKLSYLSMFVKVGKLMQRVTFSGGDQVGGGLLTTEDKNLQKAIERSPRYLAGEIVIIAVYGEPDPEPEKPKPVTSDTTETIADTAKAPVVEETVENTTPVTKSVKVYPVEINTVQKAGRALMQDYKVISKEVETKAKLLAKAAELNVEFPGIAK